MTLNMIFAGKTPTGEELAQSPLNVEASRKLDSSAMITAQMATPSLDLTATRNVRKGSATRDSSAGTLNTEEELAMQFGTKRNVRGKTLR